ncbi:MAG: hypothetical protein V2A56_05960 [bacterium]
MRRGAVATGVLLSVVMASAGLTQLHAEEPGRWTGALTTDSTQSTLRLPYRYLDPASLTIITARDDTLREGDAFSLNATTGVVTWLARRNDTLQVSFRYLPVSLPDTLQLYAPERAVRADSLTSEAVYIPALSPLEFLEREGGTRLQKRGSILRGVQVGSGQDVSLESGLHLSLEGELARDIRVHALLDDRNLPVQSEGTSRRLGEIDQVYVDIEAGQARGRFGDYRLNLDGGRYGSLDRRLEGAHVSYNDPDLRVTAAGAVTRSIFQTNTFNGSDGVQGPYPLTGREGERDILIVGGSERVWLNGHELVRGENADFTMDYTLGEITFTPRNPIDSESRIEVDFEYSPEAYPRNLYAGQLAFDNPSGWLNGNVTVMQEGDDESRPTGFEMTDAIRRNLSEYGDGAGPAQVFSADSLGPGKADYVRVDTVWTDGNTYSAFRFSPPGTDGTPTGSWSVIFSNVSGGDYDREYDASLGLFRFAWVGPGAGSWAPVRLVPLPQRLRHIATSLSLSPGTLISANADVGVSEYDTNVLSNTGDGNNSGLAQKYGISLRPLGGNTGAAPVEVTASLRNEGARYHAPSRTKEVEYARTWGLDSASTGIREKERSVRLAFRPSPGADVSSGWATLVRGEQTTSDRTDLAARFQRRRFSSTLRADRVISSDRHLGEHSDWVRASGNAGVRLGIWQPEIDGEAEQRDATRDTTFFGHQYSRTRGSWRLTGWRGHEGAIYLQTSQRSGEQDAGDYQRLWMERGAGGTWNWRAMGLPLRTETEIAFRDKKWATADSSDVSSRLARLNAGWTPLGGALTTDLAYRLSRTVTRPRVLIAYTVPQGHGDYIRVGDEYVYDPEIGTIILRPEPTGEALPTTDLAAALNVDWSPHRLPGGAGRIPGFGWEDISIVTQLEATEITRWSKPASIALLNLSAFQTDSTVNGRLLWRQDLYLWRPSREFNARLRYRTEALHTNLYGTGTEQTASDFWELRLRNALGPDLDMETVSSWERRSKDLERRSSGQRFELFGTSSETSWRTGESWTLRVRLRGRIDRENAVNVEARSLGLGPGVIYALRGRGRLAFDTEVFWVESRAATLPYELAEGHPRGRNGRVSLRSDIRVGSAMTLRAIYTLRMDEGREPIHLARVEASATF